MPFKGLITYTLTGLLLTICGLTPAVESAGTGVGSSTGSADRFTPATAPTPRLETVTLEALLQKTQAYPVDLALVAHLATTRNLAIAGSQAQVRINRAQLRLAQISLLPNIAASYVQSRFQGGTQIGGEVIKIYRTTTQPLLEVNWTLQGAQTLFQILSARRLEKSALAGQALTTQQQLSRAVQGYYGLLGAYQQKEVARQTVDSVKRQVASEEARLKIGVGTRLEVSRAKALLAQQQQMYIQADTAIGTAEQQLLEALDLDPTLHLLPDESETFQRGLLLNDPDVNTLQAYAAQHNPGLRQAAENVRAAEASYRQAWGALLPNVTLRAYVSGTGNTLDNLQLGRFAGLSANTTLLTNMGGQLAFQLRQQKAVIDQLALLQRALARQIQTQTTTAYLSSVNGKSLIDAADTGREQAELALRIASGRYANGIGTDLDVVTAQVALQTAKSTQVQAVINYNNAQVQLLEALGVLSTDTVVKGIRID